MAELLLELLSEEIPARMQARAAEDLKRLAAEGLAKAGLAFGHIESFVTPRRLALVVDGLPAKQPDVAEERRGPRVDAPQQAIDGFLRANGITLDQCEQRDTGKGVFWFVNIHKKGAKTAEVLPGLIGEALSSFPWPKSMRWAGPVRWIRPLRHVLCIFEGKAVQTIHLFNSFKVGESRVGDPLRAFTSFNPDNMTVGHRFLAPKPFAVKNFADYKKKLFAAKVMLDAADRRGKILDDVARLAAAHGLVPVHDDGLLHEVAGLVEWPVVLVGHIDESFMTLPPEVLTTTMRHHQKYFSLKDKSGKLAPLFALVSNMETKDEGAAIVAGNERVLRARLSDARFFWDQDRKRSLAGRVDALKARVFHAKLGSDFERVQRLRELASKLSRYIPNADPAAADRAAELCKADLTTGMVGEFPELQGIMGRYYALHDGETKAVADAVAEHYAPLGPDAACPTAPVSVAVALADKLDTLVGFFSISEQPTGSKDPFALRRAALGVIRLIVENELRIPLSSVFEQAFMCYPSTVRGYPHSQAYAAARFKQHRTGNGETPDEAAVARALSYELGVFFAGRLNVTLREKGVRHDLIDAVFALGGEDDLVRLLARVDALKNFLAEADGANLLVAYRRAANILKIEEKKDGRSYSYVAVPDATLLPQDEERALDVALTVAELNISQAMAAEKFGEAMAALARLRAPVDAFFDKVTVNCDDANLRANRLKLLSRIRVALSGVADFSKIEG